MSLVDLGKRLLDAAKQGDTEEVRQLMTNGAPFTTDWLGTSPLHMAAQYGHVETAEVLLRAGISRDARTKVDRTPLHIAAQEGHLEIVDLLIRHGADIEAKDMLRMTCLHWAVERGHQDVITCLLKNGANFNSSSKFFKTPTDIAMDNCRHDLVDLISEYAGNSFKPEVTKNDSKPMMFQLTTGNNNNNNNKSKGTPVILKSGNQKNQVLPKKERRPIASNRSTKPIILQTAYKGQETVTVTGLQKVNAINEKILPINEEVDGDSSSTSVLATLAALAEAAAPTTNMSSSDTLQWLESHGIAMLPTDTSTIVTSAVESGQTISLTEAGKLALNWVKDNSSSSVNGKGTEKQLNSAATPTKGTNQRFFTIVADQNQIPAIIGGGQNTTPIMVLSSANSNDKSDVVQTFSLTDNAVSEKDKNANEENEHEKLRLELEAMRKQAEEYKAQLQLKEHEAEQYKKQLEEIQAVSPKPKT